MQKGKDYGLSGRAGEFNVSWDVILRRLHIFKKIDDTFFVEKLKEFKLAQEQRKTKKEQKSSEEEKDGFQRHSAKVFMNTGITMSSKLFEAHEKGVIGTVDLVRNFQTTANSLSAIRAELSASRKFYDES